MKIVNLRGTSGSGKSSVVHTILAKYPHSVVAWKQGARSKKPVVYAVDIGKEVPLYIFGSYQTQCGGVDGITDFKNELPPLIDEYAEKGDVLFEGLLMSGGVGTIGRRILDRRNAGQSKVWMALLDTPVELCLERVNGRRAARGVEEPVNPKNTTLKHEAAQKAQHKAEEYSAGCTVSISHLHPVKDVLALLGVKLRTEPKVATFADHKEREE